MLPQGGVVETFAEVFAKTIHQRGELRVSAQAHEQAAISGLDLSADKRRRINEAIDRLQETGIQRLSSSIQIIYFKWMLNSDCCWTSSTSAPKHEVIDGLDAVVVL